MTEVRDKEEQTHEETHHRREWYRLYAKRRWIVLSRLEIARGNGLIRLVDMEECDANI